MVFGSSSTAIPVHTSKNPPRAGDQLLGSSHSTRMMSGSSVARAWRNSTSSDAWVLATGTNRAVSPGVYPVQSSRERWPKAAVRSAASPSVKHASRTKLAAGAPASHISSKAPHAVICKADELSLDEHSRLEIWCDDVGVVQR